MSEREDDLTPEAERARRAIREARAAEQEPPRADAAFRERLREAFASGRLGDAEERARPRLDRVESPEPVGPWGRERRPWYRRPMPRIAAVAAAAMLAFYLGQYANRGPAWEVLETSGEGEVRVDGVPIPITRTDLLEDRIGPGVEVEVPETATLEIVSARNLVVELTPGTKLTIPRPPPRWFDRVSDLWTRTGILRVTTGPAFDGARLDIHTPDALTRVTGTTIAVIMEPTGTCVCVLEGEVKVGRQSGGPMMAIGPGRRGYVFRDGSPLETDSIRESEMVSLARFRSTRLHVLEGGSPEDRGPVK